GVGLGWLQRQRAATAQAVEEDLQEVEVALREDRRDDARQGLQRAQDRLGTHGLPSLRRRAQQLCAEADLVAHLEEARMRRASFRGVKRDYAGADRAYTEAFAGHGIDLAVLGADEAAQRIRASPIRVQLVEALDDWAFIKENLRDDPKPILDVAGRA